MRAIFGLLACVLLTGCATGTTIFQGPLVNRDPVPPESVQLYFSNPPPIAYEMAIVTESAGGKGQRATDKAIKRLKERAGKIGANALLLESTHQAKGFIMYGPWFIPQDEVTLSARAVFIVP